MAFGFKSNKCKQEVYTKEDFAVITANITLSSENYLGSTSVQFPSGFTKDNCVVLSTMYKDGTAFKTYTTGFMGETGGALDYITVMLGKLDGTDDNKIYIHAGGDVATLKQQTIKVVLMKV